MKVAFNGIALAGPLTGVGQYAWQLASRLRDVSGVDLQLFYGHRFEREVRPGGGVAATRARQWVRSSVPMAYELTRWVRQRSFDSTARQAGFDVYHEPNFLPFRFDGPVVVTVHDLSWIRFPETHPPERVRAMEKLFEPGLRSAAKVITVSEFVRREVMEVFGVAGDLVRAIPNGLDPQFRPMLPEATRPVLAAHRLSHGRYFLSVGTLEPRKNLETTLLAYALLPAAVRERHPLVVVGMKGWRTARIEQLLAPLEASGHARVLGFVARGDLVALTAGALAMVYPSLYEGFGLPPLEAMGCGVPAVVSTASSLPEVVGDAGLQVEARDPQALADAMERLAADDALRVDLGQRSLARAGRFTWDRCAAETLATYRDAITSR